MEEKVKENNEISLKDLILKFRELFRYLLSKWAVILCYGIIGGVLGFTYGWFNKPVYSAATTFVLEEGDKGGGIGQYAGLASMVGIDLGGSSGGSIFQGDNILELYKSRTMITKTLLTPAEYAGKAQLLIDRYIDFNQLREGWAKRPELKDIEFRNSSQFTRLQDSVLGAIVNDINKNYLIVDKPDKKLNIIKAEVKAKDEFFAKSFNEQIVKNVNDFYIQTKTKKSLLNIGVLQRKTDSVRTVMNGAIYTGAVATDATPNLNLARQAQRTIPVQRSQFSVEANKAMLSELVKNLELSKIALNRETPLIQVIDKPIFPLQKEKTGKIKGLILGGFIFVFSASLFLLIRKIFRDIMN
ncbi:lipopolysaccharide biosynthesis protein [Pedobacter ginsengisoli]|uniref:Lipopolysaccharide biosynthesis protein n=1 Tax=Pedobacter ginsengisoli TaxID=363852 RepID=A0A2D1U8U3_9SPHI|nr:lipopolysaccharide biosynthesis protein [Pedobacter ginsengisoli]ATP58006.1 lipopolysaccharide biosynthesis protein [Pedobacter ginsengisoli]